jgi:Cytochrome C oxidase, cbb3-type, subunit III
MGSAWHEVSLGRPVTRWGSLVTLLVVAACGGDRDAAPASDEGSVATVDSAVPVPSAADTAAGAAPAAADTATPPADSAAQPSKPAAPKPAPAPKPAAPAQPKPDTQPQQPAQQQPAAQDTSRAAQGTGDAPLRDAYHQAPRDTVDQATYDGWKQYNLNCARCHGEDVLGTTIAPHLIISLKPDGPINTQELFVQTVCAGRPEKGMPSWCALGMDPAKINQIYSYVKGRSEGKLGPGRPALRQGG